MSKPGWRRGILGDVARGQDVAEDRIASRKHTAAEAAAEKLTLTTLLEQWSELALINRRPSCCREAVRAPKTAFPSYLNRRANDLSRADAVNPLDALATTGNAAMAGRTMAYRLACYGCRPRPIRPSVALESAWLPTHPGDVDGQQWCRSPRGGSAILQAAAQANAPRRRRCPLRRTAPRNQRFVALVGVAGFQGS